MKLKGKVAVITGGNSGIGLATAQEFKAQGAEVVIFGRTQKTLEDAVHTVGSGTLTVQGDVTHLADLDRLYQQNSWMRRCSTRYRISISKAPSSPYNGPFHT